MDNDARQNRSEPLTASVLLLPVAALLAAAIFVWQAFVVTLVWRWHIEPSLHWPTPPLSGVFGVLLLYGMLRPARKDKRSFREALVAGASKPAAALSVAWLGTFLT